MKKIARGKERRRKKFLRMLSVMLCFCLLITAYPYMPGTVVVHAAGGQENGKDSVIQALLERIAVLPDAEGYLAEEPDTEEEEAYAEWMEGLYQYAGEALDIQEEFEALTEEQQALVSEEALAKLTAWVEIAEQIVENDRVMLAAVTAAPGNINSDQTWGTQTLTAGTYTIKDGVTVTVTGSLIIDGNVTINGGGTLKRNFTDASNGIGSIIRVADGGQLTLNNVIIDGNNLKASGPAVYITGYGTVTMQNGSVIQNNYNSNTKTNGSAAAGGIYCEGMLKIDGGTIKNCSTYNKVESESYSHAGGAVYLKGTCNMTAGSITGNTATNGGGVYLASKGAELNLSGGTITGNSVRTGGNGAGIYYSTLYDATSKLVIDGAVNVQDVIYLDIKTGELYPYITSSLRHKITLACSSGNEGRVLLGGEGYTLTTEDAKMVSMQNTSLYSRLDSGKNQIYLSMMACEHSNMQKVSAKKATCLAAGYKEHYKCSDCNHLFSDSIGRTIITAPEVINQLDHSYTYTANGAVITEKCGNGCGHSVKATLTLSSTSLTYTGQQLKPVSITYTGGTWVGTEPTIGYENNTNVGTATAKMTVEGQTASVNFTITKANPSYNAPTAKTGLTYNGSAQALVNAGSASGGTMNYAVSTNGTTAPTSNWSKTVPQETNAGTYYVWYKSVGDSNHSDSTPQKITVIIAKANISPTVSMSGWTFGGTANSPSVNGNKGNGTVTYYYKLSTADDNTYTTSVPKTAGTYTVKATITATVNYNGGSATANFTISKATPTYTTPTNLTATYGQTLANVTLPKGFSWQDTTTTKVGNAGTNTFKVKYTPQDTKNYNVVNNIEVKIAVGKATPAVTAPTAKTLTYTGAAQELVSAGSASGGTLKYSTDGLNYSTIIPSATNAEAYTVYYKVDGNSNYNNVAVKSVSVTISPKSISSATICDIADQTYTGSALTPTVTVIDGGKTLASGTDYTVSYSNNISVGTADVTVTGKGNYTGSASKTFQITAADISSATVTLSSTTLTYNGSAQTIGVSSVKVGSTTLTEGTDYTVEGNTKTNAGTYTITIKGVGGYAGSEKTVTFKIEPKSLTVDMITISPGTVFYTGNTIEPDVTVVYNHQIVNDSNYDVSYFNNTNVGEATVTVTGKGNFTGTVSKNFTIKYQMFPSGKSLADYVTISPEPTNGWYGSDITLTPKSGCEVGETSAGMGTSAVTIMQETGTGGDKKTIYIKDSGGNIYQTEFTYKLDKTPPAVDLADMTVENGTKNLWDWIIGKKSMMIRIPAAGITETLSGVAEVSYTAESDNGTTQTGTIHAQDGYYEIALNAEFGGTIKLTVKDKAGHTTQTSLTAGSGKVIAEDYAPVVTFTLPDTSNADGWYHTGIEMKVTVTDDKDSNSGTILSGGIAEIQWKDGANGTVQTVADLPGNVPVYEKEFTIPVNADGIHTYYVSVVDNAGNESGWQTVTVKVDTGEPVFSGNLTVTNPTEEGADIVFTPSEGGKVYWIVSDTGTTPSAQEVKEQSGQKGGVQDITGGTENSFTITGLSAGEEHIVYAVLEDAAGNLSEVKTESFLTLQKAPEITLEQLTIDYTKETIKLPDNFGDVEVYTDSQHPESSKITPNADGSLPVSPGTAVYIRYPEKTVGSMTIPASDKAEIKIPGRPDKPLEKLVAVSDSAITVTNPDNKEEYVLVKKGETPDWGDANITGKFTGLDVDTEYDLYVRTKATEYSFVSKPTKTEIRTKAHTMQKIEAKEPTCTEAGNKEYWTCSVCGKLYEDEQGNTETDSSKVTIPAIGHDYKVTWKWAEAADDYTATAAITCAHVGSDWHCDFAETKYTGETDGDVKVTSEVTKTADCEAAGERTYTASLVYKGETYTCETTKKVPIPATGHDWNEPVWTWGKNGDINTATAEFSCKNDSSHTKTLSGEVTDTVIKKPTCTETGTRGWQAKVTWEGKDYTDSNGSATESIPAAGHTFPEQWTVEKEATESESGRQCKICEKCGIKIYQTIEPAGTPVDPYAGKIEKEVEVLPGAPDMVLNNSKEELAKSVLTEDEIAEVDSGADAKIWLEVAPDVEIAVEEKEQVQKAAEESVGAGAEVTYFGVSLFKQVGNGEKTVIHELEKPVSVTIVIPEDIRNKDVLMIRNYQIIRLHDGKTDIIEGTYKDDSAEFTFETDKFSTYAICYKDSPKQAEPGTPTPTPGGTAKPGTPTSAPDQSGQTGNEIEKRRDLSILLATGKQKGSTGIKLTWLKWKGASGYEVYWSYCDGKKNYKKLKTVKATVKRTYTHKKLKKNRAYKYYIAAYQMVDGKKKYVAKSPTIHVAMKYEKRTNAKKITANKAKVILSLTNKKYKKTFKIRVKVKKENSKKKLLTHAAELRYYTDDKKVAKVSRTGKITAKGKGKCTVYAIANNGVCKKITVTVK